jgi:hypothetical protein
VPAADRVSRRREDDRDDRCRLLCRDRCFGSAGENDIDLEPDKLGRDLGIALGTSLPPASIAQGSKKLRISVMHKTPNSNSTRLEISDLSRSYKCAVFVPAVCPLLDVVWTRYAHHEFFSL